VCYLKKPLSYVPVLVLWYDAAMAKKKNVHAVALAKLGASKGGKARAKNLTQGELSEQGRNAVLTRWARAKKSTR
jgi:hypothetical protein